MQTKFDTKSAQECYQHDKGRFMQIPSAILRTKDIATALNVSKPTACRLLHSGKIPKIQISQKCIGAFQSDVNAYLQNQRT